MLNEEKNASSPEIFPFNVILNTNKKNKKQKTRKHNQMLAQLTPSECALDESSQDEIAEKPNQSPEKGTPNNTSKGKHIKLSEHQPQEPSHTKESSKSFQIIQGVCLQERLRWALWLWDSLIWSINTWQSINPQQ